MYEVWKQANERSRIWKDIFCVNMWIWNVCNRQIHKEREQVSGRQGLGREAHEKWPLTGARFLLEVMKMPWNYTVFLAAKFCEYTKRHWIINLKSINFMVIWIVSQTIRVTKNSTTDPWTMLGGGVRGADSPCSQKSTCNFWHPRNWITTNSLLLTGSFTNNTYFVCFCIIYCILQHRKLKKTLLRIS